MRKPRRLLAVRSFFQTHFRMERKGPTIGFDLLPSALGIKELAGVDAGLRS